MQSTATLTLNKELLQEISSSSPHPRVQKIKHLLKKGADINYQDEEGYTPLMMVVDIENDRIAEYLLKQGADPFTTNVHDEIASDLVSRNSSIYYVLKGYELLYATQKEDHALIESLLKAGIDVNFQGIDDYFPLLIAVEKDSFALTNLFISYGALLSLTRKDGKGVFDLVRSNDVLSLLKDALGPEVTHASSSTTNTQEGVIDQSPPTNDVPRADLTDKPNKGPTSWAPSIFTKNP